MSFPYPFPENILRQPPIPRRRCTANEQAEEERNQGQQIVNCLRRFKRRKSLIMNMESSLSSLPDDVWFEILSHLPANDIYDLARLVCWNWYRMIYTHTFIYANLQYTPYGLLFICRESPGRKLTPLLVTMQQGRIEMSKFSDAFSPLWWSTCNGLILSGLSGARGCRTYCIANPITNQVFALPPVPAPSIICWLCGIGYAPVSMEYKVVIRTPGSKSPWGIITPGVDSSWRVVDTDHCGLLPGMVQRPPLITEGYMHWTFHGKDRNQVLSLDVETEIVTKSCVPLNYDREYDHWNYLSTGRYLTLLITYGNCLWQVWEMKSGEWRKLEGVVVDLGTQMFEQFKLFPVGWLKYLEVLVLRVVSLSTRRVQNFLYSLVTKETTLLEFPDLQCEDINPVVHKNSLVWLAGC
ncbi:hypothetical protein CASFOL_013939 [Castilleja foliolosa]|uniref:F-box domain-containing protein n=1 Tax=Castilleja foliolosa TaxID=1961234 RepID=A0ABD3DMK8_9LAMI